MKNTKSIVSIIAISSLLITGCSSHDAEQYAVSEVVTTTENEIEKNISDKQIGELLEDDTVEKAYSLVIPFNQEYMNEENKDKFKLLIYAYPHGKQNRDSRKYDIISGESSYFSDILRVAQPVVKDDSAQTRSMRGTSWDNPEIVWDITQDNYPEIVSEINKIAAQYYENQTEDFNKQINEASDNALELFGIPVN